MTKINTCIISLIVIFNLYFPKGGIKIDDVPVTIGMMLLILGLIIVGIKKIFNKDSLICNRYRIMILAAWIPFQIYMSLSILCFGFESTGHLLSLLFNFVFLPWMFLYFADDYIDKVFTSQYFFKLIKYGVLFVALFGIVNHLYRFSTGEYIEIPFFTVNYDDLGNIYNKDNGRGLLGKLVSTYQNGNLYGVCMLIMLPIFCYLDKKTLHHLILKSTIFLTLSRTIWLGLIFYEIMYTIVIKFSIKRLIWLCFFAVLIILAVGTTMELIGLDGSFLLDASLGGRIGGPSSLDNMELITNDSFTTIAEMVYVSVANRFGIVGLILFIIGFFSPMYAYNKFNRRIEYKKYTFLSIMVFAFICIGDGGIQLLPVMIFYWFVVMLYTSKVKEIKV